MQHSRVHLSTAALKFHLCVQAHVQRGLFCYARHVFSVCISWLLWLSSIGLHLPVCAMRSVPDRCNSSSGQSKALTTKLFQLQGLEIQTPRIEEKLDYVFFKGISIWLSPQRTAKKNCLHRVLDHTLLIRWSVTVVNQDVNFYIIHTCLHIKTPSFILNVKLIFVTLSPVTWLTQVRLRDYVH